VTNKPTSAATILVIEDDPDIRSVVSMTLEAEGYAVELATNGMEGIELAATAKPDLVVLDIMMPVVSGLEVLQHIRQRDAVPVIILTALGEEANRVRGLQLGADDYMVKPFSPRELVARIQAVMRRSQNPLGANDAITFDGLRIDLSSREVWVGGELVELTAKEFDLLAFLAASPGRVFTRHQHLHEVWRSSSEWQQEGTVTEHVRRLRVKIEADPERPTWLKTVRGVGYRFDRRSAERDAVPTSGRLL
jgi:DNA-binding response OmpR family regulator